MTMPQRFHSAPAGAASGTRIAYLAIGAFMAVLPAAILHGTTAALVTTWYRSNSYNHCFLIVPVALYLIWRRRNTLVHLAAAPEWRGGFALALALIVWLLGYASRTLVVEEFGLVLVIQALVLALFGVQMFRALLFPLGYLYFAVPFGDALVPPLQAVTAHSAVALLQSSGVPVLLDGNLISVPTGNWYVADTCAGLRYLIASLALGVLFAGLCYRSWWRRATFLAASILVPIAANGIRAYGIILLAYKTNNELAVGVDHIIYGFIFFTLVTFIILAVGMIFREDNVVEQTTGPSRLSPHQTSVLGVLTVGIIALLAVFSTRLYGEYVNRTPSVGTIQIVMPQRLGTWNRAQDHDSAPTMFVGADGKGEAVYELAGQRIDLTIGYYVSERPGAEVVNSENKLVEGAGWQVMAIGSRATAAGAAIPSVQFIRAESPTSGEIIWYWYWVDGRFTGSPYVAKLLQAKVKLLGGERSSAIIVAKAGYSQSEAHADQALDDFARQVGDLKRTLGNVR